MWSLHGGILGAARGFPTLATSRLGFDRKDNCGTAPVCFSLEPRLFER
jgi:hypothetical protein